MKRAQKFFFYGTIHLDPLRLTLTMPSSSNFGHAGWNPLIEF